MNEYSIKNFSDIEVPDEFKLIIEFERMIWDDDNWNEQEINKFIDENLNKNGITIEYIEKVFTKAAEKRHLRKTALADTLSKIEISHNRIYSLHSPEFACFLRNRGVSIDCDYYKIEESKLIEIYPKDSLAWLIAWGSFEDFKTKCLAINSDFTQRY